MVFKQRLKVDEELVYELAVLREVPGTSAVGAFPKGRISSVANDNFVTLFLPGGKERPHNPLAQPKQISMHLGGPLQIKSHVQAARAMKAELARILGNAAVDEAEEAVHLLAMR